MKPLQSPIDLGDVKPAAWWNLWMGPNWMKYFDSLARQIEERGPVPREVWETQERADIAEQIEEILYTTCLLTPIQFHPDDPWKVIGEWEVGNFSEVQAIQDIATLFSIRLPLHKFAHRVEAGLTFGELVDWILTKRRLAS